MRAVPAKRLALIGSIAGLAVSAAAADARADSVTIAPGQDYTLTADVMLGTTESFVAGGDATQARCKIHGAGFNIATADDPNGPTPWTGAITIRNCDIDGLGTAAVVAVLARGSGAVTIQGTTFSASGEVYLVLVGSMSVLFQDNTIQADSVVPQLNDSEPNSPPTFHAEGVSTGMKVISGNTFLVGRIHLQSTSGWLVGGETPADGNVLVGVRTGFKLENASNITIRGNYSHTETGFIDAAHPWNQVKNLSIADGSAVIVEHNVFRGLNWVAEINGGVELRYNLLFDAVERGWVLFSSNVGAKIHHNVLIAIKQSQLTPAGAFVLENEGGSITPDGEVYNNTLDAGGVCNPGVLEGAVVFHGGAVLGSFRSNAMTGVRFNAARGSALVRQSPDDPTDLFPARLLYTDYNLWDDPDSPTKKIYGAGVNGKTVGVDPGFALHDDPVGGMLDGTVDARFAHKPPRSFPFNDQDFIAHSATACQVLAFYRQAYMPSSTSPLVDHGDPAEGAGNDIGAVGIGAVNTLDGFGSGGFCNPNDPGQPTIVSDTYTCDSVAIDVGGGGGGGGGTGGTTTKLPSGVTCVCAVGASGSDPVGWSFCAAAVVLVLTRRRRKL